MIGVLPEKGATSWRDQDDIVVVPVTTAMRRVLGMGHVENIDIEAGKAEDIPRISDAAEQLMLARHRVPPSRREGAYQIRNLADVQAALQESSRTMSLLLSSIAAISLLVGVSAS